MISVRPMLLLLLGLWASAAGAGPLEAGVAVTDPWVVAQLPAQRFSATALLRRGETVVGGSLFAGAMAPVGEQLAADIARLPAQSLDPTARAFFARPSANLYRFSANLLRDPRSGFALVGIVNRMDRAYRTVDGVSGLQTCGEIRFLYRFTYDVVSDGRTVSSRLPFTLSIVLHARGATTRLSCAEIAARWLAAGRKADRADLAAFLQSQDGPLAYLEPAQVDRIEVNLQLFRLPAAVKTDFGGDAEYLLRVFRRDRPGGAFVPTRLENQVDRATLLARPERLAAFKAWLFGKAAIRDLDRGELDIPFEFLADRAISVSPGGVSRSQNQPFAGLVSDDELTAALSTYLAATKGAPRRTVSIRSAAGFRRRLNDLTCSGCHQTRAVAGFHFPGADPPGGLPANAIAVAGSAHFYGDLPRRRAIVASFAARRRPDFSRGFSARPQDRFKAALAGTQLFDGWGAACAVGADASFAGWSCANGLQCRAITASPDTAAVGVCLGAGAPQIGDATEFGAVAVNAYGDDGYRRLQPAGPSSPDDYLAPRPPEGRADYAVAHQGFQRSDRSGGFPGGMLAITGCAALPAEAICGRVAADGFNACIAAGRPFAQCLTLTKTAGLRACSLADPCREDYVCAAVPPDGTGGGSRGACIPPYFLFQFRVDGHPASFVTQQAYPPP